VRIVLRTPRSAAVFVSILFPTEKITHAAACSPLDPLLDRLARRYVDDADLSTRLKTLFQAVFLSPVSAASQPEICAMYDLETYSLCIIGAGSGRIWKLVQQAVLRSN
jgi:hypothetical protein